MDQIYRIDSVPIMKSLSIWVSVEELNQAIANFDFTVKWSYRRQGNVKVTVSTATYRSPILCQFKRATCSVLIRNGEFNAHKFLVEVPRMPFVEKTPDTTSNPLTQFINNLGASQGRNTINAEDWLAQASAVSGLYIHIPFCFHKCHYCDFYSIVGDENQQTKFVERLISEFAAVAPYITQPIETIFIGGGTPTLIEQNLLSKMLGAIATHFTLAQDYEWTIEANPETLTPDVSTRLAEGGINRVSIGAQSFDIDCLKTLERWHTPGSVAKSMQHVRNAGIENVNLDLIFGIPNQTMEVFRNDIKQTVDLSPEHISAYALTYEPNTPLYVREQRGDLQKIDEDLESRMFQETMTILEAHGYEQYEISNYAKPNRSCKHNLMYWNNKSWWPCGPAAAGHISGRRWRNVPKLSQYLTGFGLPSIEDVETLSENGQAGEALMLGLRLRDGIQSDRVDQLLQVKGGQWRRKVIEEHIQQGNLDFASSLRLTSKGLMVADTIIGDLLMDESSMVDTTIQDPNAKK